MKFLILITLCWLHLFANDIEKINSQAIDAYKSKDYVTAYELLSKIYLSKLSDLNLSFRLGVSAYELGKYEIALASFERVEMLEPNNLRNKLEKARTFFMLKMYQDAERTFKEVLSNPSIPDNVRNNIELYLSKVTKKQQKSFTYITAVLDMLYDSNINSGPFDDTYLIGNTTFASPKQKSDMALQLSADLTNIYDIGNYGGFAIKNKFSVYTKRFNTENEYNVDYLSYAPSLVYKFTKYTTEVSTTIDTMRLGSKNYLQTLSLGLLFEYQNTHTLKNKLSLKYQTKDFQQQQHSDLDAQHYELSYGLQNILSPRSYVQLNLTAVKEEKQHGTRIDVDYDEYKLNVNYTNQFSAVYGVDLSAQLRRRAYDDFSTLFNSHRIDTGKSVSAGLNSKLQETLYGHFKVQYERVNSTQNIFSYDKYTLLIGVIKSF